MGQVVEALESAPFCEGKPSVIILNTIKGKDIPFLEGKVSSHYTKLTDEQVSQVLATP